MGRLDALPCENIVVVVLVLLALMVVGLEEEEEEEQGIIIPLILCVFKNNYYTNEICYNIKRTVLEGSTFWLKK